MSGIDKKAVKEITDRYTLDELEYGIKMLKYAYAVSMRGRKNISRSAQRYWRNKAYRASIDTRFPKTGGLKVFEALNHRFLTRTLWQEHYLQDIKEVIRYATKTYKNRYNYAKKKGK